jgi:predicted PurR-regulated permease PerM
MLRRNAPPPQALEQGHAMNDHDTRGPQVDNAARLALLALLAVACARIISPFATLLLWALILAVTLNPLNRRLTRVLGGSSGRAATLLVLLIVLFIGAPTITLTTSLTGQIVDGYRAFETGTLEVPPPHPAVADWAFVGPPLYEAWSEASADLTTFIGEHRAQLRSVSSWAMKAAGSSVATLFLFIGAFLVAGVMMAYADRGADSTRRILRRIAGSERGDGLHGLAVGTMRSVAAGVVGVAFIQALLFGVGFLLAGIPAAGLLALGVLVIGIMQLPALIITLPAIAFIWITGDGGALVNSALTVYLILAGLADNVLKPMLLSRGVDAPMPVILLGALGGMLVSGLMGLFVGAVLLAMGYQLLMAWVAQQAPEPAAAAEDG